MVEQIHANPQQLQSFKQGMIGKLQQSGTNVIPSVAEPHVYHPDLAKPNSPCANKLLQKYVLQAA